MGVNKKEGRDRGEEERHKGISCLNDQHSPLVSSLDFVGFSTVTL